MDAKSFAAGLVLGAVLLGFLWFMAYQQLSDTRSKLDHALSDNVRLREQLASARTNASLLSKSLATCKNNYNDLLSQYNSLKTRYDELRDMYDKLKRELETLKSQYDTLSAKYNSLKNQYEEPCAATTAPWYSAGSSFCRTSLSLVVLLSSPWAFSWSASASR